MNIIEKTYTLNGSLTKRKKTDTIILHHAVYNGDVEGIDRIHKNNGWTCIGYHFYVRKDGSIYRGRREDTVGAHAYGSNSTSIGICAEGNFEVDTMGAAQKNSIIELVGYLKGKYSILKVIGHREVGKTACPGKNYPLDEIRNGKITEVNKVVVKDKGEVAKIQNKLNERYGFKIAVDNIFGKQTKTALVKALQTELNRQYNKGLAVDGDFGSVTRSRVIKLRQGARGNITYILQAILYCLGFDCNGLDGIFGAKTLKAVKDFQKSEKIPVDGVVGSVTWGRLFK